MDSAQKAIFGDLRLSVKDLRGVRNSRARPLSIQFEINGDRKAMPTVSFGLAKSLTPETLVFTTWVKPTDVILVNTVAPTRTVPTGSAEIPIEKALGRTVNEPLSAWHVVKNDVGEEIANVMLSVRWQAMEPPLKSSPRFGDLRSTENPEVATREIVPWPSLSAAYEGAKSLYAQAASHPTTAPLFEAAEGIFSQGCSIISQQFPRKDASTGDSHEFQKGNESWFSYCHKLTEADVDRYIRQTLRQADETLIGTVETAGNVGKAWAEWAMQTTEFFRVATVSNVQKVMNIARWDHDMAGDCMINYDHGSNPATPMVDVLSDSSSEAEKAGGTPIRPGSCHGVRRS